MKISIISGGVRVGSNAAFALQCAGIVSEIQILDANADLAEGEALDLLHGSSAIADQRICAGDYARAKDSDIFVITAGLRRKPDESRLDLINRNVALAHLEVELWPKEQQALQASARALQETFAKVKAS